MSKQKEHEEEVEVVIEVDKKKGIKAVALAIAISIDLPPNIASTGLAPRASYNSVIQESRITESGASR